MDGSLSSPVPVIYATRPAATSDSEVKKSPMLQRNTTINSISVIDAGWYSATKREPLRESP
jgi:hypothetical protein